MTPKSAQPSAIRRATGGPTADGSTTPAPRSRDIAQTSAQTKGRDKARARSQVVAERRETAAASARARSLRQSERRAAKADTPAPVVSTTTERDRSSLSAPPGSPGSRGRTWFAWLPCAVLAGVHAAAMIALASSGSFDGERFFVALILPAVVTAILLPEFRLSGWHRWAAVWGLTLTAAEGFTPVVLLFAETWVLHRFWVVERSTAFPTPPALLRRVMRRTNRQATTDDTTSETNSDTTSETTSADDFSSPATKEAA